jgi:hypothetical protein
MFFPSDFEKTNKFFSFFMNILDTCCVYMMNLVFHRLVQLNKGGRDTQSQPPLLFMCMFKTLIL